MNTDKGKDKHCGYNNFKSARYFHGMLLTDRDFREEQIYHNEKRKLHNRLLHGWGVVCGLGIKAACPTSSKIIITPGMALDCCGNEIMVCEDFEVDLKTPTDPCADPASNCSDPCVERPDQGDEPCKYYVAIKYTEQLSDPEPVHAPGSECHDKACDYTRTREGFCVKLFKSPPCKDTLPQEGFFDKIIDCAREDQTHISKSDDNAICCMQETLEGFHDSFCNSPYPCQSCCCHGEPYIVLGTVDFSKTDCKVTKIEPEMISIQEGRRYVLSFLFWQYYLGSFVPAIAEFLSNPFQGICAVLERFLKSLAKVECKRDDMPYMAKVFGLSESNAKKALRADKLKYQATVALAPQNALEIIGRVAGAKDLQPGMDVNLVTDARGGVLCIIPAKTPSERERDHKKKLDDLKKNVEEQSSQIDTVDKKISKKLTSIDKKIKTMASAEDKMEEKVKVLEKRIKDLESRLPKT